MIPTSSLHVWSGGAALCKFRLLFNELPGCGFELKRDPSLTAIAFMLHVGCISRRKSFKETIGTSEVTGRDSEVAWPRMSARDYEWVEDFRIRLRRKPRILLLTLGGMSSGRIERVMEAVFL